MITDAYVTVTCDRCELAEEEIQVTPTARDCYDDQKLKQSLEVLGWTIVKNEMYCPGCSKEARGEERSKPKKWGVIG